MSIQFNTLFFGFHRLKGVDSSARVKRFAANFANGAGYVPLVGTIIGIARMVFFAYMLHKEGSKMEALSKGVCYLQIGRGAVEAVGLGVLFLPADLVVTIERRSKLEQPPVIERKSQEEIYRDDPLFIISDEDVPIFDPDKFRCGEAFSEPEEIYSPVKEKLRSSLLKKLPF